MRNLSVFLLPFSLVLACSLRQEMAFSQQPFVTQRERELPWPQRSGEELRARHQPQPWLQAPADSDSLGNVTDDRRRKPAQQ